MNLAILVTGARKYTNKNLIYDTFVNIIVSNVSVMYKNIILIHGGCSGVDTLSGEVGSKLGFEVEVYPAEWKKYGTYAGPKRNKQMIDKLLEYKNNGYEIKMLAFHDCIEKSKGTKDCVNTASKNGIVAEIIPNKN